MMHGVPILRGEYGTRKAIEFIHATPMEYLERWIAANDVFGDDGELTAVAKRVLSPNEGSRFPPSPLF